MTQNTAISPTMLHLQRVRLTRLNADGTVAAAPNNHVVSCNAISLQVDPDILQGESKDLIGGADCLCVTYRGKDKLRRWNLTLTMCAWEPAMIEIATGGSLQVDTSTSPVPVGNSFPNQINCSVTGQPPFALEAWTDAWVQDNQAVAPFRFIRWIFPMAFANFDTVTLQNDFGGPTLKGYTRANVNWVGSGTTGPYNDWPAGVVASATGMWFFDNTLPTCVTGYSTFST